MTDAGKRSEYCASSLCNQCSLVVGAHTVGPSPEEKQRKAAESHKPRESEKNLEKATGGNGENRERLFTSIRLFLCSLCCLLFNGFGVPADG